MLYYYSSSSKGRVQQQQEQQKSAARLAAACSRKLRQTRAAVGPVWGGGGRGGPIRARVIYLFPRKLFRCLWDDKSPKTIVCACPDRRRIILYRVIYIYTHIGIECIPFIYLYTYASVPSQLQCRNNSICILLYCYYIIIIVICRAVRFYDVRRE